MDKFTKSDLPSNSAFPIASAGYVFIVAGAFATAVLALLGLTILTLIALVITFASVGFFEIRTGSYPMKTALWYLPQTEKLF